MVAKTMSEMEEYSRCFAPLVDNEVHLIERPLGDGARWDQQTHT